MSSEVDRVVSVLGGLSPITPEIQKELDRLNKIPYFPLPRVKSCHAFLEECRLGHACARIVGDSGVGKTVAIRAYIARLGKMIKSESIVYVPLPRRCTPKIFYEEIIKAMGFKYTKGTASSLRNRAVHILRRQETFFLIFDEANHLTEDALGELHYLKDLQVIQSIILIGTSRLDTQIGHDEQVQRRYPRYLYGRVTNEEFEDLVELWENEVIRLPVPSNLRSCQKSINLLKSRTRRVIGIMDDLLRSAARKSVILGEPKITYEILDEVASQFHYE